MRKPKPGYPRPWRINNQSVPKFLNIMEMFFLNLANPTKPLRIGLKRKTKVKARNSWRKKSRIKNFMSKLGNCKLPAHPFHFRFTRFPCCIQLMVLLFSLCLSSLILTSCNPGKKIMKVPLDPGTEVTARAVSI